MQALTKFMAATPLLGEGSGGPYDQITGLPMHPVIVAAVVVLVPLSVLGLLLLVLVPKLRTPLGWIVLLLMATATGATWVAIKSGEALALAVGRPTAHADSGGLMFYLTATLFGLSLFWYLTVQAGAARRNRRERQAAAAASAPIGTDPLTGRPLDGRAPTPVDQGGSALGSVFAVLALAVGLLNVVWVYRVGHSGAEAVWDTRVTPIATPAPTQPSPSPSTSLPTPSSTPSRPTPTSLAPTSATETTTTGTPTLASGTASTAG